MTNDEATALRGYLRLDGPGFDDWLHETRDGTIDGEREYKATLAQARAWGAGFQEGRFLGFNEGAKACAAWVEEQEDSALAAEDRTADGEAGRCGRLPKHDVRCGGRG